MENPKINTQDESPEERARRLIGELRGLLKDEIASFGGVEGYMRWVRGYDEEPTDVDKWIDSCSP